jgi:Holliday junction resolvase RusA-like endonuclease
MTALTDHPRSTDALVITVYGDPKPKGSMRHVGKGRMVEQVAGGKPWREAVKWAALDAREEWRVGWLNDHWRPLDGPLCCEITYTVRKPASAPKTRVTWPITRSSGDVDKVARNVLDALVDAGVMRDDSQVVELTVRKVYADEGIDALHTPGAVIRIWRLTA